MTGKTCLDMILANAVHGHPGLNLGIELGAINRVAEFEAKTLVVTGDLDSTDIFAVADLLDHKASHVRRATVPGAAHMANLDQPRRFDDLLAGFLRDC